MAVVVSTNPREVSVTTARKTSLTTTKKEVVVDPSARNVSVSSAPRTVELSTPANVSLTVTPRTLEVSRSIISILTPHAPTHEENGSDEILVELLGTAGAAGTIPVSDGAGGLEMAEIQPQHIIELDEVGSLTYVGYADPGTATGAASWRILRLDESGDPELIKLYANGSTDFDQIWDDRASLPYS